MITKWKLFNFKSVRENTELEFRPLTILAGANSSGKSTVLQSILLISQTLASKVESRSVILNGPLVRLGQFDDLRSHKADANQIFVGWQCEPAQDDVTTEPDAFTGSGDAHLKSLAARSLKSAACSLAFDATGRGERDLAQLQPLLFSVELLCETRNGYTASLRASRASEPSLSPSGQVFSSRSSTGVPGRDFVVELDESTWDELVLDQYLQEATLSGCKFRHFLPNQLLVTFDRPKTEAWLLLKDMTDFEGYATERGDILLPPKAVRHLYKMLGNLVQPIWDELEIKPDGEPGITLKDWMDGVWGLEKEKRDELDDILGNSTIVDEVIDLLTEDVPAEPTTKTNVIPYPLAGSARYLDDFFSNSVRYLGPLRDEPKPLYPLATSVDPSDVGTRGEHTASVLNLYRDELIRYVPTSYFLEGAVRAQPPLLRSLGTTVQDWLRYMGIAEDVTTSDRGKLGHELKIVPMDMDMQQDLTHVGVGVSQVLPILVSCLLAPVDTTFVIEQPELHLHPKVQTLLGDFFLSMAILGKQIVVETHSEYLINRLRFRAAAANSDEVARLLKIYFIDKKDGASVFRDVNVNEYGAIIDWPQGFFDQSQAEAEQILLAATRKRKANRNGGHDAKRND